MKVQELIKILTAHGWYLVSQKGSHQKYRHDDYPHFVIVPVHGSKEVAKGTERAILKQAKIID